MAKQIKKYSLRADVSENTERILKNVRAKLLLANKPNSIADAINYAFESVENNQIK